MATDTIAVLEHVVGEPAHLVGWSDGGIIALLVAMRRPELVGRLVTIGANFHHDGLMPVDFGEGTSLGEQMVQAYAERSPDGAEHFADLFERFIVMVATEPTLTTAELAMIAAPTLVMAGDDDMVRLEHTCALYGSLPSGQLSIVPGSSHAVPVERPAEVTRIVLDFLAGDVPPPPQLPLRRSGGWRDDDRS
jgi:pimeloyl-ACP methyl ester carboxylesterase